MPNQPREIETLCEIQGIKTPYRMRFYCLDKSDLSVQRAALENLAGETIHRLDYLRGVVSLARAQADLRVALAARVGMDQARGIPYAQGFDYGRWAADMEARKANRRKKKQ